MGHVGGAQGNWVVEEGLKLCAHPLSSTTTNLRAAGMFLSINKKLQLDLTTDFWDSAHPMSPPPHYIKQLVQPDVIPLPPLRQVRSLPQRNSAAPSGNRVEWRRSFWCWCLRCLNICPDSPGQRSPPHPHQRNHVTGPLGESPVWGGSGGHRLRTVWRDSGRVPPAVDQGILISITWCEWKLQPSHQVFARTAIRLLRPARS